MTIYIAQVFLILLMSAGFHPATNEKGRKRFLFLAFVLLTLISGIRGYTVGSDTKVYVRLYENIDSVPIMNGRFETGFIVFLKALHAVSSNPSFMLFISSIICVGTYCVFADKHSKKPTISMLLYVLLGAYFAQMNTMRQSLALSITMWSFMLMLDKKNKEKNEARKTVVSALLILLAISFHTIAVVSYVPWVLLLRQGKNEDESKLSIQRAVFRTITMAIVVFAGYSLIMRLAVSILPGYANYFYGTWSDSNYFASLLSTLINLVFLGVGAYILRGRRLTHAQRFSIIMLGLSIIFQVLSMRMEIWSRIVGLFSIYIYLMWVPEFINEIRLNSNRLIVNTGIIVFSFAYMLIILIYRPEWTMVTPYITKYSR